MALLTTKKCTNYDIYEPKCPDEATSVGDSIYEINSDKCTRCIGHYDTPTYQEVCPIPNTISKDSVHVEIEEQLWDEFVLMHYADKLQPRHHPVVKPLPCPCNKRIARGPGKTLRVAIRHRLESNLR